MKYSAIFSHASRLRESGNRFILAELEKVGLSDIAPSHGDILVRLLACEACNMSELAKQVHRTKSTVTALVEKTGAERLCAAHTGSGGFPGGAGTPDGQGARTGTGF